MRKALRRIVPTLIFMFMCFTIYSPAALAAVNPSVELSTTVSLTGKLPAVPEDFVIKLSADELSNPMPEGSLNGVLSMIMKGGGTVTFPKATFSKVGIYKYTIWQQSGTNPDCTYDDTIYHLTVFVTNAADGGLEVASVLYRDNDTEKSPAVVFENQYANPAIVRFLALKTMDGEVPETGRFTFLLTELSGTVLQTKTNQAGQVAFDEMSFNQAGVFNFLIKEVIGTHGQIIYDTAVYKAIVTVTKNLNGNYEAAVSYEKAGKPYGGTIIFANKTLTGELPYTGQTQSALPIIGAVLIFTGVVLSFKRKKLV